MSISHAAGSKPDDTDDDNSPEYDSVGKQIGQLRAQMAVMQAAIDRIEHTINKADGTISNVAEQVMPTVESLMNHPLVKGLSFGKKKP
jgi:hypothetical protein